MNNHDAEKLDHRATVFPRRIRSRSATDLPELEEQLRDLHNLAVTRSQTASPLGQELIASARAGTYRRLAPIISEIDEPWSPNESSDSLPDNEFRETESSNAGAKSSHRLKDALGAARARLRKSGKPEERND